MRRIVDWLSTGLQPGLLLYGNLGTGKTALLRALYLLFSKYRHFIESVVMDSAASIVDATKPVISTLRGYVTAMC